MEKNKDGIDIAKPCECRAKAILDSKLSFAEMPKQLSDLTINDFKVDIYRSEKNRKIAAKAKLAAANYVKAYELMQENHKGLYLYSNTKGSGKTRAAVSIGNALIKLYGVRLKFTTSTALLEEIKSTFNGERTSEGFTNSQYMQAIKSVEVLILDDIGTEKQTGWTNETLYEIINQRMLANLITIYTSNCAPSDLKHDDRIKSRITGMIYPVCFPEEDIRNKLNSDNNIEIEKILTNKMQSKRS